MRYLAVLLFAIPYPLMAQIPVVIDVPPGVYVVRIEARADGTASVTRLNVYRLEGKPDDPTEPDDQPSPTPTPISKRAQALFSAVVDTPGTKQAFVTLYEQTEAEVRTGKIEPGSANEALAFASNRIVAESGTGEAWKPFREGVSVILVEQAVAGNYDTADEISVVLKQIHAGMAAEALKAADPVSAERWRASIAKMLALFGEL